MIAQLKLLCDQYPLPSGWSQPEFYGGQFSLDELKLNRIGLSSKPLESGGLGEIVASSAGVENDQSTLIRAYFELIERISLVKFIKDHIGESSKSFGLQDIHGSALRQVNVESCFPTSHAPEEYRFSKSNGVAAHISYKLACEAAQNELIERDRFLRSWHGEFKLLKVLIPSGTLLESLETYYQFEAFSAGEACTMVLGWPKQQKVPFWIGFGKAFTQKESLSKAINEGLQRVSFLWDEPVIESLPDFAPTVDYHLDTYLYPPALERIRAWVDRLERDKKEEMPVYSSTEYLDITPKSLAGKLSVVKAICSDRIPLIFGKYPALMASRNCLPHPIA